MQRTAKLSARPPPAEYDTEPWPHRYEIEETPHTQGAHSQPFDEAEGEWEHIDPKIPGLQEIPEAPLPLAQGEEDTTDQCIRVLHTQMEKMVQIVTDMTTDKQSTDERTREQMEVIKDDIFTLRKFVGKVHGELMALDNRLMPLDNLLRSSDKETNERLTEFEKHVEERLSALETPKKEEHKKKSKWLPSFRAHAHMDYANGAFSSPLGASATARARRLHAREYELY